MKNTKLLQSLLLLGMSLILSVANAEALKLRTLQNRPLAYEENGVVTGALVEIVKEAARRTGRDVQLKILPWKRVQKEIEEGEADACFNIGDTATREKWAYFSDEVLFNETYLLFARTKDAVQIPLDLKNVRHLRVGVQRGFVYGGTLQDALDEKRFKEVDETESIEQNIKKLLSNRFDLFVGDRVPTIHHIELTGVSDQITIVKNTNGQDFVASVWPTYIAFSKKTISLEYVKKFNDALRQMRQDGSYQRIFRKYSQE